MSRIQEHTPENPFQSGELIETAFQDLEEKLPHGKLVGLDKLPEFNDLDATVKEILHPQALKVNKTYVLGVTITSNNPSEIRDGLDRLGKLDKYMGQKKLEYVLLEDTSRVGSAALSAASIEPLKEATTNVRKIFVTAFNNRIANSTASFLARMLSGGQEKVKLVEPTGLSREVKRFLDNEM